MENISVMLSVKDFLEKNDFSRKIVDDIDSKKTTELPFNEDREYSIPAYQREIRWKPENVKTLFDDLQSRPKFLGTILLNKKNNNFEIIDGQQRTTVFILILKAISKKNNSSFEVCKFVNSTYTKLFDAMNLDFSLEKINEQSNKLDYLSSDILEQRERFEKIWIEINSCISRMDNNKLVEFQQNLLDSEINIIVNINGNSSIYVDYYLDLNDKSVDLDSIDILKANLFKSDFKRMTNEWIEVQKSIKELHSLGLKNYSLDTFYHHYFCCSINKYLNYALSDLKTDLKLSKETKIGNTTYKIGTSIVRAVENKDYFRNVINELKNSAAFIKDVYTDNYISYKSKLKNIQCDNDTIQCLFSMIKTILYNDNEVPKMLVMKYFLDILNKENMVKSDIKTIFYIYLYSILFVVTGGKKESAKLRRIVLSEKWQEKIKKASIEIYSQKIDYWKKITENGKVTDISGQYLPQHIMTIKEFYKLNDSKDDFIFNQKKIKEFLYDSSCTMEHFFINKSHKVIFFYGSNSKQSEIILPKSIIQYISCPINYICLKSEANREIGNLSIVDKLNKLDTLYITDNSIFSNKLSYECFVKAKEIFLNSEDYPKLDTYENQVKAKKALKDYYKNNFIKNLKEYEKKINF